MLTKPLGLAAVLASVTIASPAKADCVSGQQIACSCPGGAPGAQVCAPDGSRFESCVCAVWTGSDFTGGVHVETDSPATVSVDDGDYGPAPLTVPRLAPGKHRVVVHFRNGTNSGRAVRIAPGAVVPVFFQWLGPMRSGGLYAGGVAVSVTGGLLIVAGVVFLVAGATQDQNDPSFVGKAGCGGGGAALCGLGGAALGLGIVALAGGIVMSVIGGHRLTVAEAGLQEGARWMPRPLVTPGGPAFGWSF